MSLVCFSPSARCRKVVPSGGGEAPAEGTLDGGWAGTTPARQGKSAVKVNRSPFPHSNQPFPSFSPSHHKVSLTFCPKKKGKGFLARLSDFRILSASSPLPSFGTLFELFLPPFLHSHRDKHTQKVGLTLFGLAPSPSAYLEERGEGFISSSLCDIEF